MAVHFSAFFQAPEATVHNALLPAAKRFSNPKFQSLPYLSQQQLHSQYQVGLLTVFVLLIKYPTNSSLQNRIILVSVHVHHGGQGSSNLRQLLTLHPESETGEMLRAQQSLYLGPGCLAENDTTDSNRCFTSIDAIKIISHRQAQRQLSQVILNSVKLTSDTNITACMHVLLPLPPPTSVKASLSLFLWM